MLLDENDNILAPSMLYTDLRGTEECKELVEKLKKLKCSYEEEYGPLEAYNAASFGSFKWLDCPWPWEREANA